jgi:hypothetical protein
MTGISFSHFSSHPIIKNGAGDYPTPFQGND